MLITAATAAGAAAADPRGYWQFADGTGIEVRPCVAAATTLCGVITRLPADAAALPASDREALCGAALLGDLRGAKPETGELARLDGWVIDFDSMSSHNVAPRYAASLVVLSETRARLEVRGTLGIVLGRHPLTRAAAPGARCG